MIDRTEKVLTGTVNGASITYKTKVGHNLGFLFKATWTGSTITGLAKLRVGIDGETWSDYPDSEVAIAAAGDMTWNISEALYPYVQIWLESLTGSITFNAWYVEKRESKIG